MQECSVNSLIRLLFPWKQCQSLKPVLSQCSQTGFLTVDHFIALYTAHTYSIPMGAMYYTYKNVFYITPIFTVIAKARPIANRAVVTNILTVIIKVALIEGFLYRQ